MPNIIIDPSAPIGTLIKNIRTERKIKNFTSRLLFFDNMILTAEKLDKLTLGGDPIRNIFSGPQAEFLERAGIGWVFAADSDSDFMTAALAAKREYEESHFSPIRKSDRKRLDQVGGNDVFISRELRDASALNEEVVLSLEFIDGLPIPPRDWSYEGILDFKRKHFSEYKRFWETLYLLAEDLNFLNEPDIEGQLKVRLLDAISEFTLKSQETFGTKLRDAISFDFTRIKTPSSLVAAGVIGAQELVHLPLAIPVAIGAAGMVNFKMSLRSSFPPLSQAARGMSYISRIRKV